MAKFVHVYTGDDGNSVVEERDFEMQSFVDTEGAHGLSTELIKTPGITFRVYEPGYFLDFHTAPRRQYSITLTGEIEVGTPDGDYQALRSGNCADGGGPDGYGALDPSGGYRAAFCHHHPPG